MVCSWLRPKSRILEELRRTRVTLYAVCGTSNVFKFEETKKCAMNSCHLPILVTLQMQDRDGFPRNDAGKPERAAFDSREFRGSLHLTENVEQVYLWVERAAESGRPCRRCLLPHLTH
jgi:hypothetical protein